MNNNFIIIVLIVLCTVLLYYTIKDGKNEGFDSLNSMYEEINKDDTLYFNKFVTENHIFTKLINNNLLATPIQKKNKILFVTFDNRKADYITLHNNNLHTYTTKYGYVYKFLTKCDYNVYWCKIQFVLDELLTNNYDYVIWLDSDTIVKDSTIDIGEILNRYSSDIFVGSDNISKFDLINAGIFIIKNSESGIEFLRDCIRNVKKICFNENGTLKGVWAATCYEQGQMNLMIADKYYDRTTVLPNDIILNYAICVENTFLMHLYASTDQKRKDCFSSTK